MAMSSYHIKNKIIHVITVYSLFLSQSHVFDIYEHIFVVNILLAKNYA